MKKRDFLALAVLSVLAISLFLFALSGEVSAQDDAQNDSFDESAFEENPEEYIEEYIKNHPDQVIPEHIDKYKELLSPELVQANPDAYKKAVEEDSSVATENPDIFLGAAADDNTIINDNKDAFNQVMDEKGLDLTIEGDIEGYNKESGKFTTSAGDVFTEEGIKKLSEHHSFKVNSDGRLVMRNKEGEKLFTSATTEAGEEGTNPFEIDDNGNIIGGELETSDGKRVKVPEGSSLSIKEEGRFGVSGNVDVDGDGDGKYDSNFGSDKGFDLSFGKDGCEENSNCVDITEGRLSMSNTGEPPSNIDAEFDARDSDKNGEIDPVEGPYGSINVNSDEDEGSIRLTENSIVWDEDTGGFIREEGSNSMTFEGGELDMKGSLFSSVNDLKHYVDGEDLPRHLFTRNEDGTISCTGCGPAQSPAEGEATGFLSFVGKAWGWITGRAGEDFSEMYHECYPGGDLLEDRYSISVDEVSLDCSKGNCDDCSGEGYDHESPCRKTTSNLPLGTDFDYDNKDDKVSYRKLDNSDRYIVEYKYKGETKKVFMQGESKDELYGNFKDYFEAIADYQRYGSLADEDVGGADFKKGKAKEKTKELAARKLSKPYDKSDHSGDSVTENAAEEAAPTGGAPELDCDPNENPSSPYIRCLSDCSSFKKTELVVDCTKRNNCYSLSQEPDRCK
ncbi:MAG: hypothetical protein R6U32_06210 [Candidatus Woesearchaeota archaeon]